MSDPYETTEQHLERLLRCALNSFDLSDTTVDRLGAALAHSSALHSSHHSAVLHRETYRHTYLLSDGTALTLWELVHGGARDTGEPLRHELYDDEGDAQIAAARLAGSFWDTPAFGDDTLREDLEALTLLMSVPPVPLPRMYAPDNSADHARRVLRRAENADRPGSATARTPVSRSTSTPSCSWTAARPACGRSSTRPRPTAATCARCMPTSTPHAGPWRTAAGSAEPQGRAGHLTRHLLSRRDRRAPPSIELQDLSPSGQNMT